MALNLYDLYHGAALNQLVKDPEEHTSIDKPDSPTQSVYIINHNICLYVKYSQGDGPWQFNFHPEHQEEIRHYHRRYPDRTFLVLVCGTDGICVITYDEFVSCVDVNFREQESITVNRPARGQYWVRGARGRLQHSVPRSRYPRLVFETPQATV